jgi:hypothetical protein
MLTARIVIVLLSVLFAGTAIAERWYILSAGTFDARTAVDLDSIAPAPGYPSAIAVLVYVHAGISTFGCSPPSDCIATSQLTYYYVDCATMMAAEIRRIPMNLRDKVIAIIDAPYPAWFSLVFDDTDSDRDPESGRRTRKIQQRHREVRSFCGLYTTGKLNEALKSGSTLR